MRSGRILTDLAVRNFNAPKPSWAVNRIAATQPPLTRRYLVEVGSPTPVRVVSSFPCTGFVGRGPDIL